jgi:hypothetical protein
MANSGTTAVGIGAIGFGAAFIYSAFTRKPMFGKDGFLRAFIMTGSVYQAGALAGAAVKPIVDIGSMFAPSAEETRRPLNNKPPGA